ncbi:MAG: hypothetical protein V1772_11890 [Chloroflexota bacterium]
MLSDGSFFCVYRTVDGHPACCYSRDGGHTWSTPEYMRYADGRLMKHPRAANFAWRCANGRYLYWFHNHGGNWYEDRNPAWLAGGVEADSPAGRVICWSQPEIALYDDDPYVRMSYPDLIEESGRYYVTETQKDTARVHLLDAALLGGLWAQAGAAQVAEDGLAAASGLALSLPAAGAPMPREAALPALPPLLERDNRRSDYGTGDLRAGFSLDLWLHLESLAPGLVLLDSRAPDGQGLLLRTGERATLELVLCDGRTVCAWDTDPGAVQAGAPQHVVAIVDGGPKLILFVVNGALSDGGAARQFGWGRYNPHLRHTNGAETVRIAPQVAALRLYTRALRVSEAIANGRAGLP